MIINQNNINNSSDSSFFNTLGDAVLFSSSLAAKKTLNGAVSCGSFAAKKTLQASLFTGMFAAKKTLKLASFCTGLSNVSNALDHLAGKPIDPLAPNKGYPAISDRVKDAGMEVIFGGLKLTNVMLLASVTTVDSLRKTANVAYSAGSSIYQSRESVYQAGESVYQVGTSVYQTGANLATPAINTLSAAIDTLSPYASEAGKFAYNVASGTPEAIIKTIEIVDPDIRTETSQFAANTYTYLEEMVSQAPQVAMNTIKAASGPIVDAGKFVGRYIYENPQTAIKGASVIAAGALIISGANDIANSFLGKASDAGETDDLEINHEDTNPIWEKTKLCLYGASKVVTAFAFIAASFGDINPMNEILGD